MHMNTSSNGNIFRVTGHLCEAGEFPAQRPVTRSFDVFFDLRLNKRLTEQSRGWWFETLSCPLWRPRNESLQMIFITNHATLWTHILRITTARKLPSGSLMHTSPLGIELPYLQRTHCLIPNVKFINSGAISIFKAVDPRTNFKGIPSFDGFRPGSRKSIALFATWIHVTAIQVGPDALPRLPRED